MKILAIDTSTTSGSIALVESGKVIVKKDEERVEAHAKWLMGAIEVLFEEAGTTIKDIDIIAIGTGPGSFTGLRIGVSTVKGLSWALGKPTYGVSTLRALAMNVTGPALICPVLDARKKQVYAALYRVNSSSNEANDDLEEVMGDQAISVAGLCEEIERRGKGEAPVFLGTGLEQYKDSLLSSVEGAKFAPKEDWRIRAVNIALIAERDGSEPIPPESLVPLYRRKSEAEINER